MWADIDFGVTFVLVILCRGAPQNRCVYFVLLLL